jgi:hypothetical protein
MFNRIKPLEMKTLKYILIAAVGGIAITALTAVSSNQASAQEYPYYTNGYDDARMMMTNMTILISTFRYSIANCLPLADGFEPSNLVWYGYREWKEIFIPTPTMATGR